MTRRIVITIVVVAIAAVVANDAWRYATAQRQLRDTTYELARWAGENAPDMPRDALAAELATMARQRGVTVYEYGQNDQGIELRTRTSVEGILLIDGVQNLLNGAPVSEAFETPLAITDYRKAGTR
jgi:hypothetical protein